MENILIKLYQNIYYTPPKLVELTREIDDCHRQLVDVLGKSERRLVLKIIDIQNHITDEIAEDSFLFGFKLATEIAYELKRYDRPFQGDDDNAEEAACRSIFTEKDGGE